MVHGFLVYRTGIYQIFGPICGKIRVNPFNPCTKSTTPNSGYMAFNGLGMNMGNLSRLSAARSRSISPENFTGEKGKGGMATEGTGAGCARDLGVGWKISPSVKIAAGETFTLADIQAAGAIQSIWITGHLSRDLLLRVYWDDQEHPAIECPLPDFFALPWLADKVGQPTRGPKLTVNSLPVSVNPNCCAYFHAQFRRVNPLPYGDVYTIVDNIAGRGHYVGTSMGWGINNTGWWGEGEIKFYLDGDSDFATIVGTGTEDYFGGSYNWDVDGAYQEYSTPFLGMHQVIRPDGNYQSQQRHAMYRWHVMDPIRFEADLRVTIQALGWRSGARYLPGQHDICSVAYWYQTLPSNPHPQLLDRDGLEIV